LKNRSGDGRRYIKAGYLWNSGNFMFRASVLLDEYRKSIRKACSRHGFSDKAGRDLDLSRSTRAHSIGEAIRSITR